MNMNFDIYLIINNLLKLKYMNETLNKLYFQEKLIKINVEKRR